MSSVLLVDVDSKIPNLALMKLSAYHKVKKDNVVLLSLGKEAFRKNYLSVVDAKQYDKVYVSIVFANNKNSVVVDGCNDVAFGGSGYNVYSELPKNVDSQSPDYSLYPCNKTSYGFITRGCVRKCAFCIVPKKEGRLRYTGAVRAGAEGCSC